MDVKEKANVGLTFFEKVEFEKMIVDDMLTAIFQMSSKKDISNQYSLVSRRWHKQTESFFERQLGETGGQELFSGTSLSQSFRARYFLNKAVLKQGSMNWGNFNADRVFAQAVQLTAMSPQPDGNIITRDRWGMTHYHFRPKLSEMKDSNGKKKCSFSFQPQKSFISTLPENIDFLTSNDKYTFALAKEAHKDTVIAFSFTSSEQSEIKTLELEEPATCLTASANWIAVGTASGKIHLSRFTQAGFSAPLAIDMHLLKEPIASICLDEGQELNLLIKSASQNILVSCCLKTWDYKCTALENIPSGDKAVLLSDGHLIWSDHALLKKIKASNLHQLTHVVQNKEVGKMIFLKKLDFHKLLIQTQQFNIKILDEDEHEMCLLSETSKEKVSFAVYRGKILALGYASNKIDIYAIEGQKGRLLAQFHYPRHGDILEMVLTRTYSLVIRTSLGKLVTYTPFA